MPKLLELVRPGGRIVVFGATAGNPPTLDMRRLFWKQVSLLGTTMGSPSDFTRMIDLFAEKRIVPLIDRVFPFEEVDEAFDHMANGAQMGKIVVKVWS
jgi:D-arabinose 1-dehydrogenase-like Zn-dependent alcohol dehydrogenase